MLTALCFGCSALVDVTHVPMVDLQGDGLHRYRQDVSLCQKQVMKLYEGRTDARNQDREFRACLINRGYVLLS